MSLFAFLQCEWHALFEAVLGKARVIGPLGNRAVHSHRFASGAKWDNRCSARLPLKGRHDLNRGPNQTTTTASLATEAMVKHLRVSEDTT